MTRGGWLGRGARTPVRNVLLTEATTKETYGRAFGLERAMDSAGAVVGPILSLALVAAVGLRTTFALTLVPAVIASGTGTAMFAKDALLDDIDYGE